MPVAYNKDIRVQVLDAVFAGESVATVAARTNISTSTIREWLRCARLNKVYAAKPAGRPRRSKLEPYIEFIRDVIAENPTIIISDLQRILREQKDMKVSRSSLWDFLEKHQLTVEMRRNKTDHDYKADKGAV